LISDWWFFDKSLKSTNGLLATTIFIQSEFSWENLMGEIINQVLYRVHREIYEPVSKMGCPHKSLKNL